MTFERKTAVIMGVGSGLGEATARAFADKGARVVGVDTDLARCERVASGIRQAGGDCHAIVVAADEQMAVAEMGAGIVETHGAIDILVTSACISHPPTPLAQIDPTYWNRQLATNLKRTLFATQAVIPHMLRSGGGRIITLPASNAKVPRVNFAPLCVTSAAVLHFTRCLALEVARSGITVNAVAPSESVAGTNAESTANLHESSGATIASSVSGDLKSFRIGVPIGRLGRPADAVQAILSLCSDEAGFISGQCLYVDGLETMC